MAIRRVTHGVVIHTACHTATGAQIELVTRLGVIAVIHGVLAEKERTPTAVETGSDAESSLLIDRLAEIGQPDERVIAAVVLQITQFGPISGHHLHFARLDAEIRIRLIVHREGHVVRIEVIEQFGVRGELFGVEIEGALPCGDGGADVVSRELPGDGVVVDGIAFVDGAGLPDDDTAGGMDHAGDLIVAGALAAHLHVVVLDADAAIVGHHARFRVDDGGKAVDDDAAIDAFEQALTRKRAGKGQKDRQGRRT